VLEDRDGAEVSGDGVIDGLVEELSLGAVRGSTVFTETPAWPATPRIVAPDQPRRKASLPAPTIASRVRELGNPRQ